MTCNIYIPGMICIYARCILHTRYISMREISQRKRLISYVNSSLHLAFQEISPAVGVTWVIYMSTYCCRVNYGVICTKVELIRTAVLCVLSSLVEISWGFGRRKEGQYILDSSVKSTMDGQEARALPQAVALHPSAISRKNRSYAYVLTTYNRSMLR